MNVVTRKQTWDLHVITLILCLNYSVTRYCTEMAIMENAFGLISARAILIDV